MADVTAVRSAAIFKDITDDDLKKLGGISREKTLKAGEKLFARGEKAEFFYLIESGQFSLAVPLTALGQEEDIVIEKKSAGDSIGWSALVEPYEFVYSSYCTQDAKLAVFSRQDLEKLMSENPALGYRLSSNLNKLIGTRVRALQKLWCEEVEQSMTRVKYWLKRVPPE